MFKHSKTILETLSADRRLARLGVLSAFGAMAVAPMAFAGPGSLPSTGSAGNYEPAGEHWFDHTVQEDGFEFGGDITLPPIWGGDKDDYRSTFVPPEKIVPTLIGIDTVDNRLFVAAPASLDPLALLLLDGPEGNDQDLLRLGGISIGPSSAAQPNALSGAPAPDGVLRDFTFDPSPSYALSHDEALAAGLLRLDELLSVESNDVNPFVPGAVSTIPAPGAIALFGLAMLGRGRRRRL